MNTAIFVALAVAAGAACPLHMWWQRRRGRQAGCCAARHQQPDLEALRARHEQLGARIAEVEAADPGRSESIGVTGG